MSQATSDQFVKLGMNLEYIRGISNASIMVYDGYAGHLPMGQASWGSQAFCLEETTAHLAATGVVVRAACALRDAHLVRVLVHRFEAGGGEFHHRLGHGGAMPSNVGEATGATIPGEPSVGGDEA